MTDTSFDDLDLPAKPARIIEWWRASLHPELQDYRLVLAGARPVWSGSLKQYLWFSSDSGWVGVNPPEGVIPKDLFTDMQFLMRFTAFETLQGAMAALEVVILRRERNLTEKDG